MVTSPPLVRLAPALLAALLAWLAWPDSPLMRALASDEAAADADEQPVVADLSEPG